MLGAGDCGAKTVGGELGVKSVVVGGSAARVVAGGRSATARAVEGGGGVTDEGSSPKSVAAAKIGCKIRKSLFTF